MEKRYNKNYSENCEIIASHRLNDTEEIVLGKSDNHLGTMYVTWFCKDGREYFWGHYFMNAYKVAVEDFNHRVQMELGFLMED